MSETPASPELSGKMFLFEKPELVSKEQHGGLTVSQPEKRFEFCARARAIPITVSEIPAAMKDYPIIFIAEDQLQPLAVTGLIDDVNLFVDENGAWEPNRYLPGYVRRYPFGVANETGSDRFAIVIDTGYAGVAKEGGAPLFNNGEPSELVQQAIEFCKNYEEDRHRTIQFGEAVKGLNIAKGQAAQFTPAGETEPRSFAQYVGIDEAVLKELPAEKLFELRNSGVLPILYAMIFSMGNWRTILQRRAARYGLTDKDILNPVVN